MHGEQYIPEGGLGGSSEATEGTPKEEIRKKAIADVEEGLRGVDRPFTHEEIVSQFEQKETEVLKTGESYSFPVKAEQGVREVKILKEPSGELGYEVTTERDD